MYLFQGMPDPNMHPLIFICKFFISVFFIYDTETQENSNGAKHIISCLAQGAIDEDTPGGRFKAGRLRKKFLSRNHDISLVSFSCFRDYFFWFSALVDPGEGLC